MAMAVFDLAASEVLCEEEREGSGNDGVARQGGRDGAAEVLTGKMVKPASTGGAGQQGHHRCGPMTSKGGDRSSIRWSARARQSGAMPCGQWTWGEDGGQWRVACGMCSRWEMMPDM
jgi:hypothetical protein